MNESTAALDMKYSDGRMINCPSSFEKDSDIKPDYLETECHGQNFFLDSTDSTSPAGEVTI